eukprot:Opistho-2@71329
MHARSHNHTRTHTYIENHAQISVIGVLSLKKSSAFLFMIPFALLVIPAYLITEKRFRRVATHGALYARVGQKYPAMHPPDAAAPESAFVSTPDGTVPPVPAADTRDNEKLRRRSSAAAPVSKSARVSRTAEEARMEDMLAGVDSTLLGSGLAVRYGSVPLAASPGSSEMLNIADRSSETAAESRQELTTDAGDNDASRPPTSTEVAEGSVAADDNASAPLVPSSRRSSPGFGTFDEASAPRPDADSDALSIDGMERGRASSGDGDQRADLDPTAEIPGRSPSTVSRQSMRRRSRTMSQEVVRRLSRSNSRARTEDEAAHAEEAARLAIEAASRPHLRAADLFQRMVANPSCEWREYTPPTLRPMDRDFHRHVMRHATPRHPVSV